MAEWDDLSDDELRSRLINRLRDHTWDPVTLAENMVSLREQEDVATMIGEVLNG